MRSEAFSSFNYTHSFMADDSLQCISGFNNITLSSDILTQQQSVKFGHRDRDIGHVD